MNKIILNERGLNKIISESIKSMLVEHYHGSLYHFTTLPLLYSILSDNNLISEKTDDYQASRSGVYYNSPFLCFTRDKNYNIRSDYGISCRLEFDADELMTLRNAKLYPVNWGNKIKMGNSSEFEERLYNVNIFPLDKYVKKIDIFINDLSSYSATELEDELYDEYYDSFYNENPNATNDDFLVFINNKILDGISGFKNFKDKIFKHYNA